MLKPEEKKRTKDFLAAVEQLKLRFPVAEISKKTNFDKGYISKVLKGEVPVSDNLLSTFYQVFDINQAEYEQIRAQEQADTPAVELKNEAPSPNATGEKPTDYTINNWREKYYQQLEENNRLLNNQLNQMQTLASRVDKRLATLEERQLKIASFRAQVDDALLEHVALQRNLDPSEFRKEVYNRSSSEQDLLAYIKDTADGGS